MKLSHSAADPLVIETADLWRIYPFRTASSRSNSDPENQGVQALRGANLKVPSGQFVALKGRSGSGKTTLLNCLAGLDRPTSGKIRVLNRDLESMDEKELTQWRRSHIGLIFQSFGLLPTLSAFENVELLLRIKGEVFESRRQKALACLEKVGLSRWKDHRPYELSGGQQQRVAVARALANQAELILADEPTGELDSKTSQELLKLFKDLVVQEKITFLMVSHDSLVDQFVDNVFTLKDGIILEKER